MIAAPVLDAAAELERFLRGRGFAFCFIGGIAVQRWGEPRYTADADATLLTGFRDEAKYVDALVEQFKARVPDPRAFAAQNRVLVLLASNGVPLDVSLGGMPFEERSVSRASRGKIGGKLLTTCSAEDLVVHKAFAGRDRDWGDVRNVIIRQGKKLDTRLIFEELEPLLELKEDHEAAPKLRKLLAARGL